MTMKTVIKYHDHLWNKARRHLKEFLIHRKADDLHQFRTKIKQLYAIFDLISFFEADFDSDKNLKVISRMYDSSGEIRDDYITSELAVNYKLTLLTSTEYQLKFDGHVEKLKDYYRHTDSTWSSAKSKGQKYLKNKTEDDFQLFAAYIISKVRKAMASANTDKEFHQIRKDIKQYLTIIDVLELAGQVVTEKVNSEELNHIQHLIGCKHDIEKLLKRVNYKNLSKGTSPNVVRVIKDEENMAVEILAAFKNFAKINYETL